MAAISHQQDSRMKWNINKTNLWTSITQLMVARNISKQEGSIVYSVFDKKMDEMFKRQYDFRSIADMNSHIFGYMQKYIDSRFIHIQPAIIPSTYLDQRYSSKPSTSTPSTSTPSTISTHSTMPQMHSYKNIIEEREPRQLTRISQMENEVQRRAEEYKPKTAQPIPELDLPTMMDVADPPHVIEKTIEEKIRERENDLKQFSQNTQMTPAQNQFILPELQPIATSVNSAVNGTTNLPLQFLSTNSSSDATATATATTTATANSSLSSSKSTPPTPISELKNLFKGIVGTSESGLKLSSPPQNSKKVSFADETEVPVRQSILKSSLSSKVYTEQIVFAVPEKMQFKLIKPEIISHYTFSTVSNLQPKIIAILFEQLSDFLVPSIVCLEIQNKLQKQQIYLQSIQQETNDIFKTKYIMTPLGQTINLGITFDTLCSSLFGFNTIDGIVINSDNISNVMVIFGFDL